VGISILSNIAEINGLSAHADSDELLRWLPSLKQPPKQIFVVHGEPEVVPYFAGLVQEKTGWNVTVPEYQTELILD